MVSGLEVADVIVNSTLSLEFVDIVTFLMQVCQLVTRMVCDEGEEQEGGGDEG